MMEFKAFLPEGDDFSMENDFDQSRVIRVESGGQSAFRASFGLIHEKQVDELPPSVDDKFYHLFTTALFTEREEAIVTLQGGDARHALDLMKEVSSSVKIPFPADSPSQQLVGDDLAWRRFAATSTELNERRERVFRLMLKLTDACQELPPAMYVTGITLPSLPVVHGGFADIYRSNWEGTAVAVKRPRIWSNDYSSPNSDAIRRVCIVLQYPRSRVLHIFNRCSTKRY